MTADWGESVPNLVIGRRLFTDGSTRDVHRDAEGRRHVEGDDGQQVYGVWLVLDQRDE